MGVKDLMKVLRTKCPHVLHASAPCPVEGDMWIDTPLLVMAAVKKAEADGHDALGAVEASLRRTSNMLKCLGGGTLHWVFDGKTRSEKVNTVLQRAEATTKYSESCARKAFTREIAACTSETTLEDDLMLAESVVILAIPKSTSSLSHVFHHAKWLAADLGTVHHATHDSEEYIARCMRDGDLAVSSDSDALPFGCGFVVQHFGSVSETWILLSEVLEALNMTFLRFQEFCVLLGTDFNERLFRCGPAKALTAAAAPSFSLAQFAQTNRADADWLRLAEQALLVFQRDSRISDSRMSEQDVSEQDVSEQDLQQKSGPSTNVEYETS
jgi:hypothetical protein